MSQLKLLPDELVEVLDDNSILVADGGDFVGSAAYILRGKRNVLGQYITSVIMIVKTITRLLLNYCLMS